MSKRHFNGLLIAVIAAVIGIAVLKPATTDRRGDLEPTVLFPQLASSINDTEVLRITVSGGQSQVELSRESEQWTVRELSNYPADWTLLQPVLAAAAEARVLELKTSNPEYFPRLGVADLQAAEGAGDVLTLVSGGQEYSVILGNPASVRGGRYARLTGTQQSVLIDWQAQLPAQALDWVDRGVIDIAPDDVAEVRILHPEGELLRITKFSADESDFTLHEKPSGRDPESSWAVNSLGSVLSDLDMQDVRPAGSFNWDAAIKITVLTFSGQRIEAELLSAEESSWLRLQASVEDDEAPEPDVKDIQGKEAMLAVSGLVDGVNARVSGWAYRIPEQNAQNLSKRMEQVLKSPESPETDGS